VLAPPWHHGFKAVPRAWFPKDGTGGGSEPFSEREALVDLFMLANHEDRNGLPVACCDPSLTYLNNRWRWDSKSRVVRFLERHVREDLIERYWIEGRRNTVTRFLSFEPSAEADTLAVQQNPHEGPISDTPKAMNHRGSLGAPGTTLFRPPGTTTGPNRTKKLLGSPSTEELGVKKIACPTCGVVEIEATADACSHCARLAEADGWTREGVRA